MFNEAYYYARMSIGVYRLLRAPENPDPESCVLTQMSNREQTFLSTVQKAVFENPANPYARMFKLAGCSYQDLKESVERDGLEPSLAAIHRAGIYLAHDEFKGTKPIVRSGETIAADEGSFLNPVVSGSYESRSGGSRSAGTVTRNNLVNQLYRQCQYAFLEKEFNLDSRALVGVMPILPSAWGLGHCLRAARRGKPFERWFAIGGTLRDSGHYRAVTRAMCFLARAMGAYVPSPTYMQPNDFSHAAEWIAKKRKEGISCYIRGVTSPCVRIAASALDRGLDIRGTVFLVGGEALTDPKRQTIEAAGAEVFPIYHINEVGLIGYACRQMKRHNCVHLQRDGVAVISHRKTAPLSDTELDSLLFTTLLPFSPRVLINAEMDDAGVVGPAQCDCSRRKAGFVDQIADIYSYGKMTGHGITLIGTDVIRLLEEVLPKRFGGSPGDYQLVEKESPEQTQILLRVSPRTGIASLENLKQGFFQELRKLYGGSLTSRQWRHCEALQVVMGEPYITGAGKVLPLHLLGTGSGDHHAS
jgi:hypothetical protein